MARDLNLGAYLKGEDGVQRLMEQIPFVARGQLWQGFKGALIHEDQATDTELMAYDDLDGTKHEVWKRRKERLNSRVQQKTKEYDGRRAELRKVKNEIRAAIRADKELGIEPDPGDLADIAKINKRMERLVVLSEGESVDMEIPVEVVKEDDEVAEEQARPRFNTADYRCEECGKVPKPDHTNPKMWLTGHMMYHKRKQKSA